MINYIECTKCKSSKLQSEFYRRGKDYRRQCKECCKTYARQPDSRAKVSEWRRRCKLKLIEHHGGQCVDCGYIGPPYQFEFDHREPSEKAFAISRYAKGYDALLEESLKCDLVCVRCHRQRTHVQRCSGCEFCS